MRHALSNVGRWLKLSGILAGFATAALLAVAGTASASGSFAVVNDQTGVGGPQTAGTSLRLTINVLVSGAMQFDQPWPTAPANGLRVRTSRCNGPNTPRDLPIQEVRIPGVGGGFDVVVYYPGSTDIGYGTCSYRGLVTLTLVPAAAYDGGGNRIQTVTIRS